jgi:starch synthase
MGVVSRVSSQKGMDLMLAAIDAFPDVPVQFVVQGLGEPDLAAGFRAAAKRHPKHIAFVERFDADLAQRIYAGCDLFLMPSSFEPCGLGQMIAMRYGTLPIVRATGGLADTVAERQDGFVFSDRNPGAMLGAILRAVHVYRRPTELARMRACAMGRDFGWKQSAAEYELMYTDAVARRTRFNPPVPVGAFAGSAT